VEFGNRYLAGAVNGYEEVLLAFFGLNLGEIDMQVADGVVLELLFRRALPVFAQRQAADAVALEATMQRLDAAPAACKRDRCGIVACSA
jgi:hypothetical protein